MSYVGCPILYTQEYMWIVYGLDLFCGCGWLAAIILWMVAAAQHTPLAPTHMRRHDTKCMPRDETRRCPSCHTAGVCCSRPHTHRERDRPARICLWMWMEELPFNLWMWTAMI